MARTLIGNLILRLRADGLGEATKVKSTLADIDRAARNLASAPAGTWGQRFQRQLEALKLAPREMDAVRQSWGRLHDDMRSRNIGTALRSSEISRWRNQTVTAFASAKVEHANMVSAIERQARSHASRLRSIGRGIMYASGIGGGVYGGAYVGRQGVTASAGEERERFRQDMAGIPETEQTKLFEAAESLSTKYRAASYTEIAEMARMSRAMMGTTDRGLAVLESMVQGLIALKSTKGPQAGASEINQLLRGIDNLGKNAEGPGGLADTRQIIDGLIRASQIEGIELDAGKLFEFARRGKIAAPALSTEFIAAVVPAFIQDMTAAGFGTAISSAYQSLVIGSNAVAGKANLAEQRRIGIRTGEGKGELVGAAQFGANPYQWVRDHLIPALQKDGIDTSDDVATAQAVAKLARNTLATGMLARMIQQREQIDRLVSAYGETMGLAAAEDASTRDPFLAWEGFKKSMENLSGAVGGMPAITSGLNSLTDGINRLQSAIREDPQSALLGLGAAGLGTAAGGKFLAGKISDMFGLKTSAIALDGSAAALTRAAIALGGAGVADGVPGGKKGGKGWWGALSAASLTTTGVLAALLPMSGDTPGGYTDATTEERERMREEARRAAEAYNARTARPTHREEREWSPVGKVYAPEKVLHPSVMNENLAPPASTLTPRTAIVAPFREAENASMLALEALRREAAAAGADMQSSLNVTATPNVDTSAIDMLLAKIRQARQELSQLGAASSAAGQSVGREMRRNFSDGFGAMP